MSIFDKWDKNVDTEGLQKDIAEAELLKDTLGCDGRTDMWNSKLHHGRCDC